MFFFDCKTVRELLTLAFLAVLLTMILLVCKYLGLRISYVSALVPIIIFLISQIVTFVFYIVLVFIEKDF